MKNAEVRKEQQKETSCDSVLLLCQARKNIPYPKLKHEKKKINMKWHFTSKM